MIKLFEEFKLQDIFKTRDNRYKDYKLLDAVNNLEVDKVEELLKNGHDVDERDDIGCTAIYIIRYRLYHYKGSKRKKAEKIDDILMKYNANVNLHNKYGRSGRFPYPSK